MQLELSCVHNQPATVQNKLFSVEGGSGDETICYCAEQTFQC